MHLHNERNFPQAKPDSKKNLPFLLNEHGDLDFSSHKNSVPIILFNLKHTVKIFIGQKKKIKLKACKNPLLWNANYDRENNDYTNAF